MPTDTSNPETGSTATATGAEGNAPEQSTPPPATLEAALAELTKLQSALKSANAEAAERRHKLKALEADAQKRADEEEKARRAKLDEAERLKAELADRDKRIEELKTQQREAVIVAALEREAGKLNFADLDDVLSVWRQGKLDGVDLDDEGRATGVEPALKALAKSKPHWLKAASGSKAASDIDAGKSGRQSGTLTVEEIARRKRASGSY